MATQKKFDIENPTNETIENLEASAHEGACRFSRFVELVRWQ